MNICELNDDCLLYLFRFLTPGERIKAWLSCRRFSGLLTPWIKKRWLLLREIWQDIPITEAVQEFASSGWIIKKVFLKLETVEDIDTCQLLLPLCSDLQSLIVYFDKEKLFRHDNLAHILDEFCRVIGGLSTLRVLHIKYSSISGQHLSNLTNLQELNFKRSNRLEPGHLRKLLLANRYLTKLDISRCDLLSNGFHCPISTQKVLESLVIDDVNYSSLHLPAMTNLKSFSTTWNNSETDRAYSISFLQQLSNFSGDSMKSLEIDAFQARLDSDVFRDMLSFQNLTRLSLKWLRNVARDGFLTEISKACKMLEELIIWDSTTMINYEDALTCVQNLKYLRLLLTYESYWFDRNVYEKMVNIRKRNKARKPLEIVLVDAVRELGMYTEEEFQEFREYRCKYVKVTLSGYEPLAHL